MLDVRYAYACHQGKIRKINQDNIVCGGMFLPLPGEGAFQPVRGSGWVKGKTLLGVFDGMGGEQRGEMAAYIAAKAAAAWNTAGAGGTLTDLCLDINRQICAYASAHQLRTCGATAAMLLADGDTVEGCNVGDSRIYFYRDGSLLQLSEDHVLPLYQHGKPPLLQFLGIPEDEMSLEPSAFRRRMRPGDGYLICSDGLTDMLPEETISRLLPAQKSMEESADSLLNAALSAGGRDNISFILLQAQG